MRFPPTALQRPRVREEFALQCFLIGLLGILQFEDERVAEEIGGSGFEHSGGEADVLDAFESHVAGESGWQLDGFAGPAFGCFE